MVVEGEVTEQTILYKQEEVDKIKEEFAKSLEGVMKDNKVEETKKEKWHRTLFQCSILVNAFIIGFLLINNLAWPFALSVFSYFTMDGESIAKLLVTVITVCVVLLFLIWRYSYDVTVPFVLAGLLKRSLLAEWNITNKLNFITVTAKRKMKDLGLWQTKDKLYILPTRAAAITLPHNVSGAIVLSEYGFAMEPETILRNAPYFDPVSTQAYADITEADAMDAMSGKFDYKILIYLGILVLLVFLGYSFWQQRASCDVNAAQFIELARECGKTAARTVTGGTPI